MKKVVIIGAGAAGIIAAIKASEYNNEVYILEKNDQIGKKIRITGKGRCNITFDGDQKRFLESVIVNSKFLYSSYKNFDNFAVISFFNNLGVETKVERGGRIFPVSDSATMVVEALNKEIKRKNIKVIFSAVAKEILHKDSKVTGVKYIKSNKEEIIKADKLIVTTGGTSYKITGSTGDGYILARQVGHTIEKIRPALVPLKTNNEEELAKLQGLALKNIEITLKTGEKEIYREFGEMLFAHFGVTGPIILSASSKLSRIKNVDENLKSGNVKLYIDLKPALTKEQLDLRIQRDFEKYTNKEFRNSLEDLLPKKIIEVIIDRSKIQRNKKVNQITKEERARLVEVIKYLDYKVTDFMPIDNAIVTAGGINVKEINPKTMESKYVQGLHFAGEVLDLDAYTGGFNLQIAFSTGHAAGTEEE